MLQTAQLPNKIAHLSLIPPPSDLYQNRRPFTKSYLLDLSLLTTTGKHYITTGTYYITTVQVLAKAGSQDPVGVKVYKFCLSSLSLSLSAVTIPPSPFSHSPLTPPVGVALTPQTTPLSSLPSFLGVKRTLRERNPTTLWSADCHMILTWSNDCHTILPWLWCNLVMWCTLASLVCDANHNVKVLSHRRCFAETSFKRIVLCYFIRMLLRVLFPWCV